MTRLKAFQTRPKERAKRKTWRAKRNRRRMRRQKKCPICEKKLSRYYVRAHIDRIHKKIKRFRCDSCSSAFIDRISLFAHVTRVHINPRIILSGRLTHLVRPFPCTIKGCLKFYYRKAHLRRHVKNHSGMRNFKISFRNSQILF